MFDNHDDNPVAFSVNLKQVLDQFGLTKQLSYQRRHTLRVGVDPGAIHACARPDHHQGTAAE